jgi:hypothetical protein
MANHPSAIGAGIHGTWRKASIIQCPAADAGRTSGTGTNAGSDRYPSIAGIAGMGLWKNALFWLVGVPLPIIFLIAVLVHPS